MATLYSFDDSDDEPYSRPSDSTYEQSELSDPAHFDAPSKRYRKPCSNKATASQPKTYNQHEDFDDMLLEASTLPHLAAAKGIREMFIHEVFGDLSPDMARSVMSDLNCTTLGCNGTITIYNRYCRKCYKSNLKLNNSQKECKTEGCIRTVAFAGYCRTCNNKRPKANTPNQKKTAETSRKRRRGVDTTSFSGTPMTFNQ